MKENRIKVRHTNFHRVNEDVSPEKMQDGELQLLREMVLDNPYNKASMRGGFHEKNINVPTGTVQQMVDVRSPNPDGSGNVNYLLAGNGDDRISRSVGGAWTDVKTGLTTGRFNYTPFNDSIIFTNGEDSPFILSGDDLATTSNLEIEEPSMLLIEGQQSTTNAGSLQVGYIYHWLLVYTTDTGERSNPSRPFSYIKSNSESSPDLSLPVTVDTLGTKILFSVLPVSSDARVTKKKLYRTEGYKNVGGVTDEEGVTFYLVASLKNSVVQYADGTPDTELDFSDTITYQRVANKAKYIASSNNRVWLANVNLPEKTYFDGWTTVRIHAGGNQTVDSVTYTNSAITGSLSVLWTFDNSSVGLTDNKYYQYLYVYVDINGLESDPVYGRVFQTATGGTGFQKVIIYYLGVGGIGSNDNKNNPNIVARRIYRTEGQAGFFTQNTNAFYLIEEEDIQHKTKPGDGLDYSYEDITSDHTNNQFAITTKDHSSAVSWSLVDRPSIFVLENIKQIFRDSGDVVTGIFDDGNGLLIFKERSIIKLYHTGASQNWYIRKIWTEFGCDEPKSLVKSGNVYYFRYRNRVYSYVSGGTPQYISIGKQATLDTVTIEDAGSTQNWLIYTCSLGLGEFIIIFDKVVKAWYEFVVTDVTCILIKKFDDFWTSDNFYPVSSKKTFEYDKAETTDEFVGSEVDISVTIKFPRISVPNFAKIRTMILEHKRVDTGVILLSVATETNLYSPINLPSGSDDRFKVVGNGGRVKAEWFDITLAGRVESVTALETHLRLISGGLH